MPEFTVKRSLTASYENEDENQTVVVEVVLVANNLDELFEELNDADFDDEPCINFKAESELWETLKEDFLITDSNGKELWRNEEEMVSLKQRGLLDD